MKNVVIIGAGPAGITVAYELVKATKDYKVTILEESNFVGGLSRTENYKGNRIDIGGHRFFSKNDEVNRWWNEILLSEDNNEMLKVERKSSILYNKNLYDYPIELNKNTIKNLGIVTIIKIAISYAIAIIHKREEKSLEDFYINKFGKKLYLIFFKDYTKKVWGVEPSLISSDWGKQRVKGLSIKEVLKNIFLKKSKETSLIKEFKYPKLGPGELWEKASEKFIRMGGDLKKCCMVVKLHQKENKIYKIDYIQDGIKKELEGDIFISSMPLRDMILSLNNVLAKINKIARGLMYRDFVTVGVLIEKEDIKFTENNISDCWIYIQEKN